MSPELGSGSGQDWLVHAQSDLALARVRKTRRVLYEHLCFHAQQASEKALKAVLVSRGVRFPRTHDLAYIMDLLPSGVTVPPTMLELPALSRYAVQQRYPGENPPLTQRHRKRAVWLAEQTVIWATRRVAARHAAN